MVSNINGNYNYNNNGYTYIPRSQEDAEIGFVLASIASAAVMGVLPYFSKPFAKQMRAEHSNNHLYRDAFFKSIDNSGLKECGVKFQDMKFTLEDIRMINSNLESEILNKDLKAGMNACYVPTLKQVRLNADKATISGFHELGHAMNHLKSKTGKLLQMCRKPGYVIAGLMGTVALFSRRKPKESDGNLMDFIQNNCGKIAFIAMLPTVVEEAMASHKGVKLAKQAGLNDKLVKNLKKFYGKAWLSYAGYAVATGLSVFAASKITERFTRPKKVETPYYF